MVTAVEAHRLRAVVRPAVLLAGCNGFFQAHVITPLAALNDDFKYIITRPANGGYEHFVTSGTECYVLALALPPKQ